MKKLDRKEMKKAILETMEEVEHQKKIMKTMSIVAGIAVSVATVKFIVDYKRMDSENK